MPISNVRSTWKSGNLIFQDRDKTDLLSIESDGTLDVKTASKLKISGTAITSTAAELNQYAINLYMADANTAGSAYVVAPHAGKIVGLQVTNYVANTTVKTVLLAKIATVIVTAPAWEIAITQAAGVASNVVPTAANAITAGAVIEINTDGGGTPVMPIMVTILIER